MKELHLERNHFTQTLPCLSLACMDSGVSLTGNLHPGLEEMSPREESPGMPATCPWAGSWLPPAAITKHHKPVIWNNRNSFSPRSGGSLKSRCGQGCAPSGTCKGESLLASSGFWCCQHSLALLACGCVTLISSSMVTWSSLNFCLHVQISPFYKDTSMGSGAHPTPVRPHLK